MSSHNDQVQAPPSAPPSQSFAERVRARIDALKRRGPQPGDLGTGAASRAARDLKDRQRRIDQAVDEATK